MRETGPGRGESGCPSRRCEEDEGTPDMFEGTPDCRDTLRGQICIKAEWKMGIKAEWKMEKSFQTMYK